MTLDLLPEHSSPTDLGPDLRDLMCEALQCPRTSPAPPSSLAVLRQPRPTADGDGEGEPEEEGAWPPYRRWVVGLHVLAGAALLAVKAFRRWKTLAKERELEWRVFCEPGQMGNAEFIRLVFEECQVQFQEVWADGIGKLEMAAFKEKNGVFALPVLQCGHAKFIQQTPVIIRYLAEQLDGGRLVPPDQESQVRCEEILSQVMQMCEEATRAWQPGDIEKSHQAQAAFAEPWIQKYKQVRLPKWLNYFEAQLQKSQRENITLIADKEPMLFFVGTECTYVDLCVFQVIDANRYSCPEVFTDLSFPLLMQFYSQIRNRPRIRAYLNSPRRNMYSNDGPMK